MSGTRDESVFMAKLAEQAERFEDMIHHMTHVAGMGSELSVEERNLLSIAFKNAVGARRQAWRQITAMMAKEAQDQKSIPQCVHDYKALVETELKDRCTEILRLLAPTGLALAAKSSSDEAKVFYQKMEGDYYRYLAEFSQGDDQTRNAQAAFTAYNEATAVAKASLPSTHPIRLGLALNFSVFYFEVYGKARESCQLAKESYDAACADIDKQLVSEEQSHESRTTMSLLHDNLQLWMADAAAQGDRPLEQDGTVCEDM